MRQIQKLTAKGYQSIQTLESFELRPLNVLIGANGANDANGYFNDGRSSGQSITKRDKQ